MLFRSDIEAALLEDGPLLGGQHVANAAGVVVAVSCKPCCPPLDHFYFVDVFVGVRVPNAGAVLQVGSDKGIMC